MYKNFFKQLTGFDPYTYQVECFKKYFEHTNMIIQAPTGSGKTWAAITPFIFSWQQWEKGEQKVEEYPRKLIYSLPLRTLANSLYKEVANTIKKRYPELNLKIKLQTGEYADDPFFEGDIIFTTIDQTLSNVLGIPLSLPQKLANINAGAVFSSYLIFDEFHLLDPNIALKTTVTLLELMSRITPFCLMTATLSNSFLEKAGNNLKADLIKINNREYQSFAFVRNNSERKVNVKDTEITVDDVLENHKNKSIVICNTVDRCIELYKKLSNTCSEKGIELLCIHSRFFQKDRKNKEENIIKLFSKNDLSNCILVSTQVIEVGLDISCNTMYTEISPINSFLQRIGRCARWGGQGEIFVYDVPENNYLPYDKVLSQATFIELLKLQKENLDFFRSQQLIENVLCQYETKIYYEIKYALGNTWDSIRDSWRTGNPSFVRTLIRDIRSISVVLLPEGLKTDSLYKYESISMNPFSVKKKVNEILDRYEGEQPTILMKLEESNFNIMEESDSDYLKVKVLERLEVDKIHLENIVALNSNEIKYSTDYGLDFISGKRTKSKVKKAQAKFQYQIKMDTYKQHITWMLQILEEFNSIWFPLNKIQGYKYKSFDLKVMLKLIIVMHDYGKLNDLWQNIVCDYQTQKSKIAIRNSDGVFLAHSDFDPNSDVDKDILLTIYNKYKVKRKPEHSGIGAFVVKCLLPIGLNFDYNRENESFLQIVTTTILRHHSALTKSVPPYKVSETAIKFQNDFIVKQIVPQFYLEDTRKIPYSQYRGEDLSSEIIQFNDELETILYFLFVRTLRLCDQKSFKFNQ